MLVKERKMAEFDAYIPMDRRQALHRGESLPPRTTGAALFADVFGFTPLTGALVAELGSKRGAEGRKFCGISIRSMRL
jgi:hypothetical protein